MHTAAETQAAIAAVLCRTAMLPIRFSRVNATFDIHRFPFCAGLAVDKALAVAVENRGGKCV